MSTSPDVVVIGGGIAGVSIGYELAAHRTVIVLEAEASLAVHSTGRSAATFVPGHGTAAVRALISASGARFARLEDELGTPALLSPRPVLWAAFDEPGEQFLRAQLADRAGEPDSPRPLPAARAESRCPALRPGVVRLAAITETACDIDAMALHHGYVRGLKARGGAVHVGAAVTAIEPTSTGWRVRTAGGDVFEAAEVVNAAGAWADAVARLAGVAPIGLAAFRRTIAVARVPDPSRLHPDSGAALPMVIEAMERCYFKAEGDNLLLSPGDETAVEAGDARADPLDIAAALERVEELTGLGLRSVQSSWAGLRSFVADRAPVVGARPESPGFHFFAGQGGSGIESAPALAAVGAAVITGSPVPPDIALDPVVLSPTRLATS